MGQRSTGYFCPQCKTNRMFVVNEPNHVLHALLSLFLCGTWLIVWLIVAAQQRLCVCSVCGFSDYGQYLADPGLRKRTPSQPSNTNNGLTFVAIAAFVLLVFATTPLWLPQLVIWIAPAPEPTQTVTPRPTTAPNTNALKNANTQKPKR